MKKLSRMLVLSIGVFSLLSGTTQATQILASKTVAKTMSKRAANLCSGVLPAWIKSGAGMRDAAVRRIVADCYLAQARLPLIGAKTDTLNTAIILDELPYILLKKATGLHFGTYTPLAGTEIRIQQTHSLQGSNNE